MRVAASSFPFALPTRYAGDSRADHQVAVTCAGETVVYASPEDLRAAVLQPGVRTPFAPGGPAPRPVSQTARTLAALAGVALLLGALAGFALFGLAELDRAGLW